MKIIITIIFLLAVGLLHAQCLYKKEQHKPPPYYLNKIETTDVEQDINTFFDVNVEFWEYSQTDRVCYFQDNSTKIKITIGKEVANDSMLKTPIYVHLVAYYFLSDLKFSNDKKEKELLADFLSGYYYCYHNITSNWEAIKNSTNLRIDKAKELNAVMDAYIIFYENYIFDDTMPSINLVEKKQAFLNGTYYAMPPKYRMYVNSKIDFGNDIVLLFENIISNNDSDVVAKTFLNNTTLKSLKFKIKKTE